jgi:hypothetical protein
MLQGTLTVRRQLVVEDPGSRVRVKAPKSHNGMRTLVLDPATLDLVRLESSAMPGELALRLQPRSTQVTNLNGFKE